MPNLAELELEIQSVARDGERQSRMALGIVRTKYLKKLREKTGRNVVAYYSAFLSKPFSGLEISDEDKNGFMMAVHGLDRSVGLDLILHTPGGSIASTQSLVHYLRKMFADDIRAVVPQIAMSAGTMIACSCREIIMGKHSNIGPIDPHLRGIPAFGVLREFQKACRDVKKDPAKAELWRAIVGQYRPSFLGQCENAIAWSNTFVQEQLSQVMFKGEQDAAKRAKAVVKRLSDFRDNRTHERHIHADEAKSIGLRVTDLEADQELQELVLTVHHCYMHLLMNSNIGKIVENHDGASLSKQMAQDPRPR